MHTKQSLSCFQILHGRQSIQVSSIRYLPFLLRLRRFHNSRRNNTDGVYPALTEMRVKIPWIEALRKQRAAGMGSGDKSGTTNTLSSRDLKPKKMSDSYHRFVGYHPTLNFLSC